MEWTYLRNEDETETFTPAPGELNWDKWHNVDFVQLEGGTAAMHSVPKLDPETGDPLGDPSPPVVQELFESWDWFLSALTVVRQFQASGNTEPTFTFSTE